jgi:hypothetical protein
VSNRYSPLLPLTETGIEKLSTVLIEKCCRNASPRVDRT